MNTYTKNEASIRAWILGNASDHIDPLTDEYNCTGLAEDAIIEFEELGLDDEVYFELAVEVVTKIERNQLQ